jgi:hypothetical protein
MFTIDVMIIVLDLVLLRQIERFINIDSRHKKDILRHREIEMLNATFRRSTEDRKCIRDNLSGLEPLLANWRYFTKLQPMMAWYRKGYIKHLSPTCFIVLRKDRPVLIWKVILRTEQGGCSIQFYGENGGAQRVYRMMVHVHDSKHKLFRVRYHCKFDQSAPRLTDETESSLDQSAPELMGETESSLDQNAPELLNETEGFLDFPYHGVLSVHGDANNLRRLTSPKRAHCG